MLCVLCATQDGDAGAVSSPFFQLCMRSGGLDREGDMSPRAVRKMQETPATLCFILTHLY